MTSIITSDLHLNDSVRDAHRFDLFPWLAKQAQEYKADQILILGDITDAKDGHPATLVNRIVDAVISLRHQTKAAIIILRGNHDCIDPAVPFFGFLRHLAGIVWITDKMINGKILYIANRRSAEDWPRLDLDYAFVHQTFTGAVAENGQALTGFPRSVVGDVRKRVYSGDVHVPQDLGNITYVGAPYRIKFGDKFLPRVLLLDDKGKHHDLHFPTKLRALIECEMVKSFPRLIRGFAPGDQIKIRVSQTRAELVDWAATRKIILELAEKEKLEVCGISAVLGDETTGDGAIEHIEDLSPGAMFDDYADRERVAPVIRKAGKEIMEG